jgi:hypothetical protein
MAWLLAAATPATLLAGCDPGSDRGGVVRVNAAPAAPPKPWQVVRAAATSLRGATTPTKIATPSYTVPVTTVSPAATERRGPCLPLYGPSMRVPVTVTASAGKARVTWFHNGDAAAIAYWLGTKPRTLATATAATTSTATTSTASTTTATTTTTHTITPIPITWIRIVPPAGCRDLMQTLTLSAGNSYTIYLELESRAVRGIARHTLNVVANVNT